MSGPVVLNGYRLQRAIWSVGIMRPSKWGNPFRIVKGGMTRAEAIAAYRALFYQSPYLMAEARAKLKGRDLRCCCAPLACHGDVLLEYANADDFTRLGLEEAARVERERSKPEISY